MVSNGTFGKTQSLTPRQAGALPHIVAAPSLRQGARAAGIGYTTVARWMQDPRFRAEVERARQAVTSVVYARLRSSSSSAQPTSRNSSPPTTCRPASALPRIAFDIAIKAELNSDLRKRLDYLSRTLRMIKETR